jgi:hypothetical protein
LCQSVVHLRLSLLLGSWKGVNLQVLIRFQQNLFKQEGKYCILRSISLLSWSGTKKNCLASGNGQLSYLFTKRVIKLTVVIIDTSFLSTSYKILSHILLCRLTAYADEISGDHYCGFQHNRSTTDQMFCI